MLHERRPARRGVGRDDGGGPRPPGPRPALQVVVRAERHHGASPLHRREALRGVPRGLGPRRRGHHARGRRRVHADRPLGEACREHGPRLHGGDEGVRLLARRGGPGGPRGGRRRARDPLPDARAKGGPGAIDPELVGRFGLSCEGVDDRTRMDYESKVRSYSRYLESRRLDLESAGEGDVAAFAAKIAEDYSGLATSFWTISGGPSLLF